MRKLNRLLNMPKVNSLVPASSTFAGGQKMLPTRQKMSESVVHTVTSSHFSISGQDTKTRVENAPVRASPRPSGTRVPNQDPRSRSRSLHHVENCLHPALTDPSTQINTPVRDSSTPLMSSAEICYVMLLWPLGSEVISPLLRTPYHFRAP